MRVAILGAGGIALGYAAELDRRGHQPALFSPSGAGTSALRAADLLAAGAFEHRCRPVVAETIEQAIAHADVVIIALPANAHWRLIDRAVPHVCEGQTLIVSAQLSLSSLYLSERLAAAGTAATVVAWGTTVLMGRRTGPSSVATGGLRDRLEMAVLPAADGARALSLCEAMFGDRFRLVDDPLTIALSNLNPPIHLANVIGNFTRIERGETWMNYDGITPSVARLIEALDRERLGVAAAYGLEVRTVEEHYRLTFGLPEGLCLAQMAAAVHERRKGPPGPTSLDTRFVTEDVPFGIAEILAIGGAAGLDLPLHRAGLDLVGALYGRDFTAENDLLPLIRIPAPHSRGAGMQS